MKITAEIVARYLWACEQQKKLSAQTIKDYRIDLRQFTEFLDAEGAGFDRETVKRYVSELNGRCKPRTVKRKTASLRAFGGWLADEGLAEQSPFLGLRLKVQEPVQLPKTIPLRVVERLLEAARWQMHPGRGVPDSWEGLRDAAVLELLFATGLRVSELCGLQTREVDLIDGTLRICGKGAKERILQITNPEVLAILRRYARAAQPSGTSTFFQNRRRAPLSDQSVRRMIRKYSKMIGVTVRITPHMFRHSLATMLLEEDVDLRYIQQLLGHSSVVTTQIYTHVAGAKQRSIMETKHPRNKFSVG